MTSTDNRIRFWGVRGSIASPGPHTLGVGGNTTCAEVFLGDRRFVIDGGTGLRALGQSLRGTPLRATVLLSHLHWDHIQGVPFFAPLYNPASSLRVVGPRGLHLAFHSQMSGPMFPVGMDVFNAELTFETINAGATLEAGEVTIFTAPLRHPGGAIAYRLEHRGCSVVHAVDTEHADGGLDLALLELCCGAGVLVYDAQYLPEEYEAKRGWGHSTHEHAAELARAAGVHTLVLTHHDPTRDDAAVLQIEQRARALFPNTWCAREGLTLEVHAAAGASVPGDAPGRSFARSVAEPRGH